MQWRRDGINLFLRSEGAGVQTRTVTLNVGTVLAKSENQKFRSKRLIVLLGCGKKAQA